MVFFKPFRVQDRIKVFPVQNAERQIRDDKVTVELRAGALAPVYGAGAHPVKAAHSAAEKIGDTVADQAADNLFYLRAV